MARARTLPRLPLLALALCAGVHAQAPAVIDRTLDTRLESIQRLAYDHPEKAQRELERVEREPGPATQPEALLFARGRVMSIIGDTRAAESIAEQLAKVPGQEARTELLRAEIAIRGVGQTPEVEQAAMRVRDRLADACAMKDARLPFDTLLPQCDFRALWAALDIVWRMHQNRGEFPLAQARAREALQLATAGADRTLMVASQGSLALLSQIQGQRDEARRWLTEAIRTAQGDALDTAQARMYEAMVESHNHDLQGEFRAFEQALESAQRADAPHTVAQIQANLTDYYMTDGKPLEAIRLANQVMPVLMRFKDRRRLRVLYHNLAVADLEVHRVAEARAALAEVEKLRSGVSDTALRIVELTELSGAWARAGDPREAIRAFREERGLSEQVQARNRAVALQQVRTRFDSERKQHELELLKRDAQITDQELSNQSLAQSLGMAVAGLTVLSLALIVVMLLRVRKTNRSLRERHALLRLQSERDALTNLANRRYFMALMEQQGAHAFTGSLMMVDVDHFKHVNDANGHTAGDTVIAELARRLTRIVRDEDVVVRWGGEEYLVYVRDIRPERLQQFAERILFVIGSDPVKTDKGPLRVTASIGFATFPLQPAGVPLHWERAVSWVDKALYHAKANGRNRAVGVLSVAAKAADELARLEQEFESASASGRVQLLVLEGALAQESLAVAA